MAQRPDLDAFCSWLGVDVPGDDDPDLDPIQACLDTALEYVEGRLSTTILTAKGFSIATDSTTYPNTVRTAVRILGSALYKRRTSPEGVAGFGELGVVRMVAHDEQVEMLIEDFIEIQGFA